MSSLPGGWNPGEGRSAGAPALLLRLVAGLAADVAIRRGLEALDDIAVVLETAAEHKGEDGAGVAGNCDGCVHGAVSVVPIVGNGGDVLPRTPARRPAHGQTLPLRGACAGMVGRWHQAGARHGRGDPSGVPRYDSADGTADESGSVR